MEWSDAARVRPPLFLEVERAATKAKVRGFVESRHTIRVLFHSVDAVSNLEHILFGFCCAFAGDLASQGEHGATDSTPSRPSYGRVERARRAVRSWLLKLSGIRVAVLSTEKALQGFLKASHLLWKESHAFRFAIRLACTAAWLSTLITYQKFAHTETDVW